MKPPVSSPLLALTAMSFAALLTACAESDRTGPPVTGPSLDISESRFGSGNPDFFFSSPLARSPQAGDVGYDEGASHGGLVPYVRICETDGDSTASGCTPDVTQAVTGSATGLAMTYSADAELYQVNWQTKALTLGKDYRIEVWGIAFQTAAEKAKLDPRWLFGWRDIRHSPSVSTCTGLEEFCLINYGQTIPIKVRIEDFVFCPVDRNCAVQFVAAGADASLRATLADSTWASNAQVFIPAQGGTDFALAFEPCTAAETEAVDAAIDLPTFGPCLKTLTNFSGTLATPAIISICEAIDHDKFDMLPQQMDRLALHHFTAVDPPPGQQFRVEALPEAFQCSAPSGTLPANWLSQFASALTNRVRSIVGVQPLQAAAAVLHRGGGGHTSTLESLFKLALPAKFAYENVGDAFQRGLAGQEFPLRVRVTDLYGDRVKNARVHWTTESSPGEDASVSPLTDSTDAAGISETTATLSDHDGNNVFHAWGRGIADSRESGCSVRPYLLSDARCNGPRDGPFLDQPFDPFYPLHDLHDGPGQADGQPVELASGTRLPFTVYGCLEGRGTATVNGVLGAGEWDCASSQEFPVNLSGGSTVMATLYWMNNNDSLYLAVAVPGTGRENSLRIDWNNNGGAGPAPREVGDDVWEFSPSSGTADKFVDEKCVGSSQSGCGLNDNKFGGKNDTRGVFRNDLGDQTVYEMSHPLGTTDKRSANCGKAGCDQMPLDISLVKGQTNGMFVTLRLGSGAQGNTQWPGFLNNHPIAIK